MEEVLLIRQKSDACQKVTRIPSLLIYFLSDAQITVPFHPFWVAKGQAPVTV
jgi:hypothetical protein